VPVSGRWGAVRTVVVVVDDGVRVGVPWRGFASFRGQSSFSGWWWSATAGAHVGFESWLERDQLMVLDFDPAVIGIVSQPFRLSWRDETGARRRHVPDYFARLADGSGLVVDVRADDRVEERDQQRLLTAVPDLQVGSTGPAGPLPVTGRPLPNHARSRPPCRFCAARRGAPPTRRVDPDWVLEPEVWLSVEDNVCLRHQVWIGPDADSYDQQLDLRALPEIVQAQTRHRRLIRRRGRRETFLAYGAPLAWDHVGRRIGSLSHRLSAMNGGANSSENP
jgi:hypothetical protein